MGSAAVVVLGSAAAPRLCPSGAPGAPLGKVSCAAAAAAAAAASAGPERLLGAPQPRRPCGHRCFGLSGSGERERRCTSGIPGRTEGFLKTVVV